ncbi:MAG TPA: hypothetical protein PK636_05460, partial [bacterium]|nr:hypothetical protein [bacterium]
MQDLDTAGRFLDPDIAVQILGDVISASSDPFITAQAFKVLLRSPSLDGLGLLSSIANNPKVAIVLRLQAIGSMRVFHFDKTMQILIALLEDD